MVVLGIVDTEVYKVLRILTDADRRHVQLFEVLTLDNRGLTPWRAVEGISGHVETNTTASNMVIRGVVHLVAVESGGVENDCIARFNLKTEEWMPSLRGPITSHPDLNDIGIHSVLEKYSLAEVNGSLVVARFTFQQYTVKFEDFFLDLWYLGDSENCQWERKYRIDVDIGIPGWFCTIAYLSSALQDGRFLLCLGMVAQDSEELNIKQILVGYNPETWWLLRSLHLLFQWTMASVCCFSGQWRVELGVAFGIFFVLNLCNRFVSCCINGARTSNPI